MTIIGILALCATASAIDFEATAKLTSSLKDDSNDNDYFTFDTYEVTIDKELTYDEKLVIDYTIKETNGGKVASGNRALLCRVSPYLVGQDATAVELFKGALDLLNKPCPISKGIVTIQPKFDLVLTIDNLVTPPCDKTFDAYLKIYPSGSAKKIVKIQYLIIPKC